MTGLCAALVAAVGLAAAADDVVVDALQAELDRTAAELALPDAPRPHTVLYDYTELEVVRARGQLGTLVSSGARPSRRLGVGLRVGTPQLDSANFRTGWRDRDGFDSKSLVVAPDADAIRHDAWLLADHLYREAVENLAVKEAARARRATPKETPDYVPAAGAVHRGGRAEAVDLARVEQVAREVSAVFRGHPGLIWSEVRVVAETGRRVALDSRGTLVERPTSEVVVVVMARVQADDGMSMVDHLSYVVRTPADLPAIQTLQADAKALAERLEAWAELPVVSESYVGPVLFEGDAAVDVFRRLLLPALQGTAPEERPSEGSRTFNFGSDGGGSALRPMRRVLPPGFTVVDDPLADPTLPSSFEFDDEGVPAEAVVLVTDGIVRRHLASTTTGEHTRESNGHARGMTPSLKRAMPGQTTVTSDRVLSDRKLQRSAMDVAGDYDLDHVVVVRRLSDPRLSGAGLAPSLNLGSSGDGGLPPPVEVVRRYADGREEPVRGWSFVGLDRRALRDITSAGSSTTRTILMAPEPGRGGPSYGVPVTVTAPSVLVAEVELQPGGGNADRPPPVPSPLAELK